MSRVLVVEDEESYSDALAYMLRKEGFEVAIAATGNEALAEFDRAGADIVLLDLMLPGIPGTEVCRQIRQTSNEVAEILARKDPGERFAALRGSSHPQAQFLWSIFRDLFHYAAFHLESIADNARDLDLAIRWGFGWQQGPFETWQLAGWQRVAAWISEDIAAGRTLAAVPLPQWVNSPTVVQTAGVYSGSGAYSPRDQASRPRPALAVYKRQRFPDPVVGESFERGTTMFETDALRMWHLRDDVGIVSFRTKQNTVSEEVLDGLLRALDEAERHCGSLVIWQQREPFSLGANLAALAPAVAAKQWERLEAIVAKFQDTSMRLRYSAIPTVAAVRGMALGGSCEFILHCDRVVAAHESYIGLVETGVGLLPGGAGTKELAGALRAGRNRGPLAASSICFRSCAPRSRPLRWRACRAVRRMRDSSASCATRTP